MVGRKVWSFKSLSHKAARLNSISAKAGLGAMMVTTEIPVIKPTVAIASMTVGVSAASIRRALQVSAFERELLVGDALTLAELDERLEPAIEGNGSETSDSFIAAEQTPSAEQVLAHEKSLVFGPRMTVDNLIEVYTTMSSSEKIAFGRAIGVERVWLPRQRKRERERNGHAAFA
jgi:hypothetical protein